MKLSIEAKVAAAVAVGFIALSAVAIGQGGSEAQSGAEASNYALTENSRVHTRSQAYNGLLPDHLDVEDGSSPTVSEERIARTSAGKTSTGKSRKNRKTSHN